MCLVFTIVRYWSPKSPKSYISFTLCDQNCVRISVSFVIFQPKMDFRSTDFSKTPQYVTKICQVEAEMFHVDGQTHR
jgi:hypothetical protein